MTGVRIFFWIVLALAALLLFVGVLAPGWQSKHSWVRPIMAAGSFLWALYQILREAAPWLSTRAAHKKARRTLFKRSEQVLSRMRRSIAGLGEIQRYESTKAASWLGQKGLVILAGQAGTGKSGIVAQTVEKIGAHRALLIDARDVANCSSLGELSGRFGVQPLGIEKVLNLWAQEADAALVIDQLDSVWGLRGTDTLLDLVLACRDGASMGVMVVTRTSHKDDLIGMLKDLGLAHHWPLEVGALEADQARSHLEKLGLVSPATELVGLATYLLELSMVADIAARFGSDRLTGVDGRLSLWTMFMKSLEEREGPTRARDAQVLDFACKYALESLTSQEGMVDLPRVRSREDRRLVDRRIIVHETGRRYRFRHESFRDYLYAWDAAQVTKDLAQVVGEVGVKQAVPIISWMFRIYHHESSPQLSRFAEEALADSTHGLEFFDKTRLLEALEGLDSPPAELARAVAGFLKRERQFLEFFVCHLTQFSWAEALHRHGFFSSPPKAILDESGVRYPQWHAGNYLARMAEHEPRLVAEILSKVRTDNPYVLADMIQAASSMPVAEAPPLVKAIAQCLDDGVALYFYHQRDLIGLATRLAEEPATQELAHDLVRAYLFPNEEPPDRLGRHDQQRYLEAMKPLLPVMLQCRPEDTLRLLCQKLAGAIEAKGEPASGAPLYDYSYIWRPAIEEHAENRTYDEAGNLVTPLRDAAEQIIGQDLLPFAQVLATVESYKYLIFLRLRIHLTNEFADRDPSLACQTMMAKALFDDHRFKHEYAMLLGRRFDMLSPNEQSKFFEWVDAGPNMSGFDDFVQSNMGREPTEEDRQDRIKYWQLVKLWWVRDHLTDDRKARFDKLLRDYGEPELADLNVSVSSSRGTESPIPAEDIKGLSFEEVLDRFLAWRPNERDQVRFLADDLPEAFGAHVKQNSELLSGKADLLIGKPAMFVRPFVGAMQDAVGQSKAIDFSAVLRLCQWAVEQPIDQDTRQFTMPDYSHADENWEWCRDGIADFVSTCCSKQQTPFDLRDAIWQVLMPLLASPDKDRITDTEEEDIRTKDFMLHSLNNPRGHALGAVFKYTDWVTRFVAVKEGEGTVVRGGFDSMPEVRDALEAGLDFGAHDSFALRAVYGRYTPLLYWIDRQWLSENIGRIFNLQEYESDPESAFGWAAWNAFLVSARPHIEYFELLAEQFKYAVGQYQGLAAKHVGPVSPAGALAQHLIILYGRGQLALDDHDGLLRGFLTHSDEKLRSYAIAFAGQGLQPDKDDDTPMPQEIVDRFVLLWDWYWPEVGSKDEQPSDNLFGYWYVCKRLDRRWALDRLAAYAERVPLPEPDYEIPEQLACDAKLDPAKALAVMAGMMQADPEGWRIGTWEDSAKKVLACALAAEEPIKSEAAALIDRLGRKGFLAFGELLR